MMLNPAVNSPVWLLPACPVAGGGRCEASHCDGAWTLPRKPCLCRPVAGSETFEWYTGSPTACGSLGWGSPSTEAARTTSPGEETETGMEEEGSG